MAYPDIAPLVKKYAALNNVPEDLAWKLIKQESAGKQYALSPKGASGYMQLMPATAKEMGVTDIYDPEQNIMGGMKYFGQQLKAFGDPSLALAAYNAGPAAVKKYGGIPPYKETQNYVRSIMGGNATGGQYARGALTSNLGGGGELPASNQMSGGDIQALLETLGYGKPKGISKILGGISNLGAALAGPLTSMGGMPEEGKMWQQIYENKMANEDQARKEAATLAVSLMKPKSIPSAIQEFQYYQSLPPEQRAQYEQYLQAKKYSPMMDLMTQKFNQQTGMMNQFNNPTPTQPASPVPNYETMSDEEIMGGLTDEEKAALGIK